MGYLQYLKDRFTVWSYGSAEGAVDKKGVQGLIEFEKSLETQDLHSLKFREVSTTRDFQAAYAKLGVDGFQEYIQQISEDGELRIGEHTLAKISQLGTEALDISLQQGEFKGDLGTITEYFGYAGLKCELEKHNIEPVNSAVRKTSLQLIAQYAGNDGVELFLDKGGQPFVPDPVTMKDEQRPQENIALNEARAIYDNTSEEAQSIYQIKFDVNYAELEQRETNRQIYVQSLGAFQAPRPKT